MTALAGPDGAVSGVDAWSPTLRARVSKLVGGTRPVVRFTSRSCPYTSSFKVEELDLHFIDGSVVALLVKHLGRNGLLAEARKARPRFLEGPLREIKAYKRVLPHCPPGPPALLGTMGRLDDGVRLVLERVPGDPLWQVGDFTRWEAAATWLAAFHRTFAPERARRLGAASDAIVYDRRFYKRWIRRAQRFAAKSPARRAAIDEIAERYDAVADRLVAMDQTLIHGEFYASNIIVQDSPLRICAVDWEMLALGPGLVDLAALSAGFSARRQVRLARAYWCAATGESTTRRLPATFMRDLLLCRLHLAVRMLGWSNRWEAPAGHQFDWLAEAAALSAQVHAS